MKARILSLIVAAATLPAAAAYAQKVNYSVNASTGAISKIWLDGPRSSMNWILDTDGSQYSWIGERYGWGLGYFSITTGGASRHAEWHTPTAQSGGKVTYVADGIAITVTRRAKGSNLTERYTFTNTNPSPAQLDSIGIYTPFNDNYPNAETCLSSRAHAHVWAAGNASYANLVHMGASAPNLGLVLTAGRIGGYDIWGRNRQKGSSNARGVFALAPESRTLAPGESFAIEWKLFANDGWEDFFGKLVAAGSVCIKADKYVYEKGETATLEITGPEKKLKSLAVSGCADVIITGKNGHRRVEFRAGEPGEKRIVAEYGNGEMTFAEILVRESLDNVVASRVGFIAERQQMNDPADPRYGAYLIYDNETDEFYLNDTPNVSPGDRCEGAERVGMGIALAKYCLKHPGEKLKASLVRYAEFVRRGLQDADYNTWRSMSHAWGYRVYNYAWIAELDFLMYRITGAEQYVRDGYGTLKAMYRSFGHSRYPIGVPVRMSLECLAEAGMAEERASLLADYRKVGEAYLATGLNFPRHEVNYEQSIVAPSVVFLTEMYLLTGEEQYLGEARRQMPVLEAFGGRQPSFHLHDIAIRHWDGYWFGKRPTWGDTMPHYWSCITAQAFHNYSLCISDPEYQRRALNIVASNLCLFTDDGRGSCAYIYPNRVNGAPAKFYDPFANDQDFALAYWLDVAR